jgi:hypothetical protein
MGSRRLKETISEYNILLFKKRGATVDTSANTITATQKVVSKTVDRHTAKLLKDRGQLTVVG